MEQQIADLEAEFPFTELRYNLILEEGICEEAKTAIYEAHSWLDFLDDNTEQDVAAWAVWFCSFIQPKDDKGYCERQPTMEPFILLDAGESLKYAEQVIMGEWPEAENVILSGILNRPSFLTDYARVLKKRWLSGECQFLYNCEERPDAQKQVPQTISTYSQYVLRGAWSEAEGHLLSKEKFREWKVETSVEREERHKTMTPSVPSLRGWHDAIWSGKYWKAREEVNRKEEEHLEGLAPHLILSNHASDASKLCLDLEGRDSGTSEYDVYAMKWDGNIESYKKAHRNCDPCDVWDTEKFIEFSSIPAISEVPIDAPTENCDGREEESPLTLDVLDRTTEMVKGMDCWGEHAFCGIKYDTSDEVTTTILDAVKHLKYGPDSGVIFDPSLEGVSSSPDSPCDVWDEEVVKELRAQRQKTYEYFLEYPPPRSFPQHKSAADAGVVLEWQESQLDPGCPAVAPLENWCGWIYGEIQKNKQAYEEKKHADEDHGNHFTARDDVVTGGAFSEERSVEGIIDSVSKEREEEVKNLLSDVERRIREIMSNEKYL